jgi:hypothetical protein
LLSLQKASFLAIYSIAAILLVIATCKITKK